MNIIDGNGASEVLRLSALHTNKVVKTQTQKAALERLDLHTMWCRRPDSNRHVFLRLILNQLRLPISPLRH